MPKPKALSDRLIYRIEEALRPAGLDWITALRAPAIKHLVEEGTLQLSLFDQRDLAEVSSPDYPGERLIVCKNPLLAEERRRKREKFSAAWPIRTRLLSSAKLTSSDQCTLFSIRKCPRKSR